MILLVLVLWPLAELAAAIAVAHAIGVLWCVILLLAGWPAGSWLLRAEGRTTLRRFREALATGRAPGAEVADRALALLAGPLLIVPGFITDVIAVALLVRPLRRALAGRLMLGARSRFVARAAGFRRGARRPYDVDSTAHDAGPSDRPQLHG